ncbi:MAG: DNA/RNA nuclease SfsA [Proteobacteria bacterium]|nr:DNA/RNA nuclease SfsA [Pseudomonadota bacterium]
MEFVSPLTQAILLKRYKRFLVEIVVNNQDHRVIYCPNMGAMTGCDILGSRIWFSQSCNNRRKFPHTWELVEVDAGHLVYVNTQNSTDLIKEGIEKGIISQLQGYQHLSISPPLLDNFAFDISLSDNLKSLDKSVCFVHINQVTLGDEIHRGFFPDAPTEKGAQQLKALIHAKAAGYRAVLLYCVQHTGINRLFPADHIDSKYGSLLRQAMIAGVEIYAYRLDITLSSISIMSPVEVCIPARMICSSRL